MRPVSADRRQPARHARALVLTALLGFCWGLVVYCRLALRTAVVSTHILYVPIALSGVWFGRGGIVVAAVTGALVLMLGRVTGTGEPLLADALRAVGFLALGACVGIVSERASRAQRAERESRDELELAQRRLVASERMAAMGQLSAGIAHELNNPLGTIVLYSHILLKDLPDDDPRRPDLEVIAAEANRCGTIVHGLLDFARQSHASRMRTDLGKVIHEVIRVMEARAGACGVRLACDVEHGLPEVLVDPGQIKQLLVNLVQNGVDAIDGSGTVGVRARQKAQGRAVEILVQDDGAGIDPEDIDRVFTPFFTTKRAGRGTGLGLALAYGVAKMHSGDISVQSEPGHGTTFSLELPVGDPGQQQSAPVPPYQPST
jgi:signal transduction histidine kinase